MFFWRVKYKQAAFNKRSNVAASQRVNIDTTEPKFTKHL